jgi:L-lactate dehydrogenase
MAVRFDKVAIIGTGHVGATAAYAMMLRGLFTQILLIDADGPRAQAEALDIADANALARPAHVLRGDYRDAGDAAIVVITAGATTHGEESRLSVAGRSAAIVADCARRVVEAGFGGVMIVASNPVDAMAQVAQRASGLPVGQVIGTGTLLDSARFRRRLADRLGVAPVSVEGQVLGEHGDSEVAVFSGVRIGGVTLDQFRGGAVLDRAELAHETMRAGYAINYGKGHTSYGVATAIAARRAGGAAGVDAGPWRMRRGGRLSEPALRDRGAGGEPGAGAGPGCGGAGGAAGVGSGVAGHHGRAGIPLKIAGDHPSGRSTLGRSSASSAG